MLNQLQTKSGILLPAGQLNGFRDMSGTRLQTSAIALGYLVVPLCLHIYIYLLIVT